MKAVWMRRKACCSNCRAGQFGDSKGKEQKITTDRIMEIREEWKKVGPIERKANDKVSRNSKRR